MLYSLKIFDSTFTVFSWRSHFVAYACSATDILCYMPICRICSIIVIVGHWLYQCAFSFPIKNHGLLGPKGVCQPWALLRLNAPLVVINVHNLIVILSLSLSCESHKHQKMNDWLIIRNYKCLLRSYSQLYIIIKYTCLDLCNHFARSLWVFSYNTTRTSQIRCRNEQYTKYHSNSTFKNNQLVLSIISHSSPSP